MSSIGFFSDEEFANFSDPVFYCESKEFNKTVYHANFYFKYRVYNDVGDSKGWIDPADSEPGQTAYDWAVGGSDLVYCFNVGNGEFLSQDATMLSEDGKTACWNLDPVNENYLHFTFSLNNGSIINYEQDDVLIETLSADTGEIVQFRVVNPSMVEKIIIKDKNGNIIPYNVINKSRGEYSFSFPEEDVTIQVQYRENPNTYRLFIIIPFVVFFILSMLYLYYKYRLVKNNY